jgi:hypothetical protein
VALLAADACLAGARGLNGAYNLQHGADPLSESQGLVLTDDAGFRRFYAAIAQALGSDLPEVDFVGYGREVAAFEAAYRDRNKLAEAARTLTSPTTVVLRGARSQLAVITSCDALALATSLIATCHVVAARDMVSPNMMAAWVEAFYRLLPTVPLSEALDFALRASGAPMRLYAQQPDSVNLRMQRAAAILEKTQSA